MDRLRRARAEDLPALSALCLRSKAHWGYDAEFLEACREDLTLRPSDLESGEIWMLDGPVAVVQIVPELPSGRIEHLFLDLSLIGTGFGRQLFEFACHRAQLLGCQDVSLTSEPRAAGFYEAMGGVFIEYEHSTIFPGRKLPRYAFSL